jgi:hypothetical protein
MIVVLSLAGGAVVGVLVSTGLILSLKAQVGQLKRKLRHAEKAAEQLQVLPLNE